MVVLPEAMPWATPTALIVATKFVEDAQVTCRVMSSDEPSLKFPVAVNAWFVPTAIDALEGVSVMDVSVALFTVKLA